MIRLELRRPGNLFRDYHLYNVIVTSHALVIIFFLVIPIILGGFGNWLIPLMLCNPDIAFARLNNLRFWLLPISMFLFLFRNLVDSGFGGG